MLAFLETMVQTVVTNALYTVITKRVTDILECVYMVAKETTQETGVVWKTKTALIALPILYVLNVRQAFINKYVQIYAPKIV